MIEGTNQPGSPSIASDQFVFHNLPLFMHLNYATHWGDFCDVNYGERPGIVQSNWRGELTKSQQSQRGVGAS